jgi:uncharacterized membrane protein HdeD (DUF308 family)
MNSMNSNIASTALDALTDRWWVLIVRGVAAILFGILAFAAPSIGALALVIFWGVYAIANGVLDLMLAGWAGRAGARFGWYLIEGLVSIAAGVIAFAYPAMTGLVLLYVIATWAILTGIVEIGAAVELRRAISGEWLLALAGVLSIAFGVVLFAFPSSGALAVVWLIGAYAIVFGVVLIALGVRLNQLRRAGEQAFRPGTPKPA